MSKHTYIIAVNATSGGGKTSTTKELQKQLPNAKALYFDDRNYDSDSGIDDVCKWVEEGADVNKFNLERLSNDIELLLRSNPDYIILDYPFSYRHNLIGKHIDLSIFIDTPLDMALARRIIRDYDNDTMHNIFSDMKQYLSQGRNAYLYSMNKAREDVDFIVDGSKSFNEVVELIKDKILFCNTIK